jgi:3'(2'), 5'-bisphosphate nucleotidase
MHMSQELDIAIAVAQECGSILMQYFRAPLDIRLKADAFDPVTQADTASDNYLRKALADSFPSDSILSEENPDQPVDYSGRVWMADPLDGTKDFIAGRDTYSVIIGLLVDGVPTVGVVYVPARDELFFAEVGAGAFQRIDGQDKQISASDVSVLEEARMFVRIPTQEVREIESAINAINVKVRIEGGSIGSRMCAIANGTAEVFVNTNHRASKWDTLGGEVILSEAGGIIRTLHGSKLDYTQPGAKWPELFVAGNNEVLSQQIVDRLS